MRLALYTDSVERLSAAEAFDLAARCGASGVELGAGGQSPASHLRRDELLASPQRRAELLAGLAARGLEVAALNCSSWPLHPVHGPADEQLIRDTLRLAGELGVETVVTMSGCPGDGPAATTVDWVTYPWPADAVALLDRQWDAAARLWEELASLAREAGVRRIALELHPLHLVYNVPTLLRLRELVGEIVGANLDPSHLFWQGADPVDAARELGPAVHHVHLKDASFDPVQLRRAGVVDTRPFADPTTRAWSFATVGRGHGVAFWQAFLSTLAAGGYDGALAIENEDPTQTPEEGVLEAAAFIRPLIPTAPADRFERSRRQHERARQTLAGGVATNFRSGQLPVPVSFVQGRGARLYDIDGNAYVDYALAFGPMLLGHSPHAVVAAVSDQARTGIGYGASHVLEAELAEIICRLVPCAERVVVSNTGSEAVHAALRIARSATGRPRVVKFAGQYDGWLDPVHVGTPGRAGAEPGTGGQDPEAARNTIVCPWNDLAALERVLDEHVAAVIMEPLNVNGGCLHPDPGYLEGVRALTRRAGALLVFDEVITGFRLAPGGAQERFGVEPDLAVLGKAIASGFPLSAVCGRADVLDEVVSGRVAHVGTFNANPVCAAAAVAALGLLERRREEVYPRLAWAAEALAAILEEEGAAAGVPLQVRHDVGVGHAFLSERPVESAADVAAADADGYRRFAAQLLTEGVHVIPRGLLYVSSEHGEAELELTRAAVARAARAFAAEGVGVS
jgi:glutamate-1-semialdehyde 2,1-aminomutase